MDSEVIRLVPEVWVIHLKTKLCLIKKALMHNGNVSIGEKWKNVSNKKFLYYSCLIFYMKYFFFAFISSESFALDASRKW